MNTPANSRNGRSSCSQARQTRRPVDLGALVLLDTWTSIEVTVLNLTYDGCCIGPADQLTPEQALKLSVPGLGIIDAQVRWCRDGMAGLLFMPQYSEQERDFEPRIDERLVVEGEVSLRKQGQPSYQVRLFDLSRHGCKIEFVQRPRVGDHIWIKFEGLESLDAEVCWIEGFQAGLRYVNPIHPAVFDLLTKRFSERPQTA